MSVQDGDYYRLLTNGNYRVTASVEGFLSVTKFVTVVNKPYNEAQVLNFTLQPVSVYKIKLIILLLSFFRI